MHAPLERAPTGQLPAPADGAPESRLARRGRLRSVLDPGRKDVALRSAALSARVVLDPAVWVLLAALPAVERSAVPLGRVVQPGAIVRDADARQGPLGLRGGERLARGEGGVREACWGRRERLEGGRAFERRGGRLEGLRDKMSSEETTPRETQGNEAREEDAPS